MWRGSPGRPRDSVPDRGDLPDDPQHRLRFALLHRRDARQPDDELASMARSLAERLHLAAVELDQPAYQGEPDAQTALGVNEPALALRRRVEHVRQQPGWNADPRVRDADDRERPLADDANADRAARRGVLDRVQHEIRQDLVEPRRIRIRPDGLGAHVDDVALEPTGARQIAHRPLDAGREI